MFHRARCFERRVEETIRIDDDALTHGGQKLWPICFAENRPLGAYDYSVRSIERRFDAVNQNSFAQLWRGLGNRGIESLHACTAGIQLMAKFDGVAAPQCVGVRRVNQ